MSKRTKIMALVGVMLVGAFVVFMGVGGFAANTGVVTVTAGVAPTISVNAGPAVNFGSVAPGVPANSSTTMTVDSNKTWNMTVTRSAELASGSYSANAGDLQYTSSSLNSNVKGLQTTAIAFGSGTNVCSGSLKGGSEVVTINYSLNLSNWDIPDGTSLTATHTYTATQP